jgi:2-dehydropantoate 2-reductase
MKVGILGSGGVGSLFGGFLAGAGHEVWFVDARPEHVEAINRGGLLIKSQGESRRVAGSGTTDPGAVGDVELLMLWCKSQSSVTAIEAGQPMFGAETIAFTAQNGLGNPEQLEAVVGPDRLVYGTTEIGGTVRAPGVIEVTEGAWTGTGKTYLGSRDSRPARERLETVAGALRGAGLTIEVTDQIDSMLWNKVSAASLSPVAASLRLRLTDLLEYEEAREIIEDATREVAAVANAKGILLDADTAIEKNNHMYSVAVSPNHLPSMVVDVLRGQPTEIGSTCEMVARLGAEVGVDAPVNRTLGRLMRTVEQHYGDQLLGTLEEAVAE